jgi:Carboxypeptidase regulatory-like domain
VRFLSILTLFVAAGCSAPSQPQASAPAKSAPSATGPAIVTGQTVPGAIVMLEPADKDVPLPEGPAILDQYGKAFVPDVLFVRVGQVVEFRNSDDTDHNIRVLRNPTGSTVMDVSGSQHQTFTHTFDQQGIFDVSCDVHPGMKAVIVATSTPYAAYADAKGAFSVPNVPPGQYRLKISADGRDSERLVKVSGARVEIEP